MRGKWVVEIRQEGGSTMLSSGDLYNDEWVEKYVSRFTRCLNPGDYVVVRRIDIKRKKLTNPLFPVKDYE